MVAQLLRCENGNNDNASKQRPTESQHNIKQAVYEYRHSKESVLTVNWPPSNGGQSCATEEPTSSHIAGGMWLDADCEY